VQTRERGAESKTVIKRKHDEMLPSVEIICVKTLSAIVIFEQRYKNYIHLLQIISEKAIFALLKRVKKTILGEKQTEFEFYFLSTLV
jgi:hypothetical protein